MRIEDSWPQLGGGTRYHIVEGNTSITIDQDRGGKMSGFVRTGSGQAEADILLKKAFTFLKALQAESY